MSSQTVSRRPRPRRQPLQKRTSSVSDSNHTENDDSIHINAVEDALLLSSSARSSPRRRRAVHNLSPRRKLEQSPVRRTHQHTMPKSPLEESLPSVSPKQSLKSKSGSHHRSTEMKQESSAKHTQSKIRRRPAIGKLTIRIEGLKAENLVPATYQVPLDLNTESVRNLGGTVVNTINKQPTNLTRAILNVPDALVKTSANVVTKTSDVLKKSTDAFLQLHYFDYGWKTGPKTSIQKRTCSPEWPEVLELQLGADAARALLKCGERLELRFVQLPLLAEDKMTYRVLKRSPNDSSLQCHNATGEFSAKVSLHAQAMVELPRGGVFPLQSSKMTLGLSCPKSSFESCVVVFNRQGQIMWKECAYNDNSSTPSVTISYNDSESKDLSYYHMDRCNIELDLQSLPDAAVAMFLVVHVPANEVSLQLRILETESKVDLARYVPDSVREPHSVILARLSRHSQGWAVTAMDESFPCIQDFGNLIPVMNKLVQDLVSLSHHNGVLATTVLRRQRPIFLTRNSEQWKLAISWEERPNKNNETSIHFRATALLLDGDFHVMDQITASVDSSRRGGVIYKGGARRRCSAKFEDFLVHKIETISIQDESDMVNGSTDEFVLNLSKLTARVRYVCFNIGLPPEANQAAKANSIRTVSLQLYDERMHHEFARFASPMLSESGLLLACMCRSDRDSSDKWVFEVASVEENTADMGKLWKAYLMRPGNGDARSQPYNILPQDSKVLNLESKVMPELTVLDPTPLDIPSLKIMKCL